MLIAEIDRNKETTPEKQVNRIVSPYWTLPVGRDRSSSQNTKDESPHKGITLRVGNRKGWERRRNQIDERTEKLHYERRHGERRKIDSRWNPATHDVMIIAVEKKPENPKPWKVGGKVIVQQADLESNVSSKNISPPPTKNNETKPPLLVKNDEDYIVHLSGKTPKQP